MRVLGQSVMFFVRSVNIKSSEFCPALGGDICVLPFVTRGRSWLRHCANKLEGRGFDTRLQCFADIILPTVQR